MSTHADDFSTPAVRRRFFSIGQTPAQRRKSIIVATVSITWPVVAHFCWNHPATWIVSFVLYLALTWTSGLKFTAAGLLGGVAFHIFALPHMGRVGDVMRLGTCIATGVGFGAVLDWLSDTLHRDHGNCGTS